MKTPDLPAEDTSPGTRLVRAYLRHEEWSVNTFGPDKGPVGPLKDLSDYVDYQFLVWDAMRRAGVTLVEFIAAIEAKQKLLNAQRYEREPSFPVKGQPPANVAAAQQAVRKALLEQVAVHHAPLEAPETTPTQATIDACERTKRRFRDEPRPAFTRDPWSQT